MRLPRTQSSVPSLITTVFVLAVMLAFVMDFRERTRKKAALSAAAAAYQQARRAREKAELWVSRLHLRESKDDEMARMIQIKAERARADEQAKKAEFDRLRGARTGRFW